MPSVEVKRRTFKQLRARTQPELRHNDYVVLLDPAVGRSRENQFST
jgi:hypothetical protein